MYVSVFDIFSVGVGPSSSHTVGPMRAARRYLIELEEKNLLSKVSKIDAYLYGSLALTGIGHGTIRAIVLGLMGITAETMDVNAPYMLAVERDKKISLLSKNIIDFEIDKNVILEKDIFLKEHSNGMIFKSYDNDGNLLFENTYFSIGGGFVLSIDEIQNKDKITNTDKNIPYPFNSAEELLDITDKNNISIAELVVENELALIKGGNIGLIYNKLDYVKSIFDESIELGMEREGILPGGLGIERRAKNIYRELKRKFLANENDPLMIVDWVNLWSFAVAEENATGGRVVTAPTNGSAGVIPSVVRYFEKYATKNSLIDLDTGIRDFILTASAIANLYKNNASIAGAEVGCQGEIGVACSMAAAGLVAAMGGSPYQIENAAEIGMEHNLGLTCDPIKGLVQVPCIERNAFGALKAINAARIALKSDGKHFVSLDKVIRTMYQTGKDMKSTYKETSKGGLAVNVVDC